MRVLEVDPSILYKMGKNKKHRIRKARENNTADASSDEAQSTGCPHVVKAVNLTLMRKTISRTSVSLGECSTCCKEGTKSTTRDLFGNVSEGPAPAPESEELEVEPTICICLQCGHQGCDRNSLNKHALKHYKTPHSSVHSIIVNLTTWSTWCYVCDEEVAINTRIQNCIDVIQKQLGLGQPEPVSPLVKQIDSPLTDSASSPLNNTASFKTSSPSVSCAKVKGLSNLGNTCFFNAVMQSITQTRGLESLLLERTKQERVMTIVGPELGLDSDASSSDSEREEDGVDGKFKMLPMIQTVYGDPGPITLTLLGFLQEMKGGSTKNGTVNPSALFTQVCKKAPRFKGFQQQDSHELLRYLVDCIRTEEIKRGQSCILKFFKLTENVNPKKVDDDTKTKIKEYGKQVKHTFLDFMFGGQLVSTVKCEECKNVSQIYEAFLDISVPVTEEKPQRPNFSLLGRKKDVAAAADNHEDGATADVSAMGLDAYTDKPSKYQEKKNKKIVKKDSKRKSRLQKSKSSDQTETGGQFENEEKGSHEGENASDDSNKAMDENDSGDASKANAEVQNYVVNGVEDDSRLADVKEPKDKTQERTSLGSMNGSPLDGSKDSLCDKQDKEDSRDDPSDADVEDNLDGEAAQQHHVPSRKSAATATIATDDKSENTNDLNAAQDNEHAGQPTNTMGQQTDTTGNHMDSTGQRTDSTGQRADTAGQQTTDLDTQSLHENGVRSLIAGVNKLVISAVGDTAVDGCCESNDKCSSPDSKSQNCDGVQGTDASSCSLKENGISVSSLDPQKTPDRDGSAHVDVTHNAISSSHHSASVPQGKSIPEDVECVVVDKDDSKDEAQKSEDNKLRDDQNVLKTKQKHLKEAKQHAMNSLAPRYHPVPKECSILSCLNQFTAAELLTGSNKVVCKECTKRKVKNSSLIKGDKKGKDKVYSNASKQYLIFKPPSVLTLHLKRFEQTGLMSRKVNRHVDFPLVLDLGPYCSALASGVKEGQTKVLYSLYGIVEHSGRLSGGHYTAYIKVRPGISSYTQFLHTQPPGASDVLNIYYERILKMKMKDEACSPADVYTDRCEGVEAVDQDLQARAECLAPPGRWFHISDSRVNEVSEAMVLKAQAYLLFYERIF